MITEANIQQEIRLAMSQAGHTLHRNNVGAYMDPKTRRMIRYGVGDKGGSDLIGWTRDGVFLAIEVKKPGGRIRQEQRQFIAAVRKAGGLAGIARSAEDALMIAEGQICD